MKFLTLFVLLASVAAFVSCSTIPKNAQAVTNFNKEKYLGKWYEIARFDFKFERDLNNTTARYSLNDNGTIRVENRGYNTKKNEWKVAVGKVKFVKREDVAMLKVSFFGPFYSGYNVVAIDTGYNYALVAGKNLDYLWILSRTTSIPENVKTDFLQKATNIGYDITRFLWVEHNKKQ